MEKSKVISLLKRFATSVVLIPAVICCVLSGYPLILLLAWLGAVLMSWEWADMVKNTKPSIYALIYFFVVAWCLVFDFSILTFIIIFGAMLFVFLKSKNEEHRWLLTMGVPYIGIGLGSVLAIYNSAGPLVVLWFMFVVWAVDIGGFCFGCTIKGPKLAPRISPNKTWSGFCGGMLLAVAISSAFCWYLGAVKIYTFQRHFQTKCKVHTYVLYRSRNSYYSQVISADAKSRSCSHRALFYVSAYNVRVSSYSPVIYIMYAFLVDYAACISESSILDSIDALRDSKLFESEAACECIRIDMCEAV